MKLKLTILTFITFCSSLAVISQSVGINDNNSLPDASSILDIKSTDKGILIPRTDTTSVNANFDPADGLLIYTPADKAFYYYASSKWVKLEHPLTDKDGDTSIELEHNPDEDQIRLNVKGKLTANLLEGAGGVKRLHTNFGKTNVFIGLNTGRNTGLDSTFVNSGKFNTAIGDYAFVENRNGLSNTAIGSNTMELALNSYGNTAIGHRALRVATGDLNTAIGIGSLESTTTGFDNTAVGMNSGSKNKGGFYSVFIGRRSGNFDTTSVRNVYIGTNAGAGGQTLSDVHSKSNNVMIGYNSGENAQGSNNVFLGNESGANETGNHKLYIENSDANENSALIYGEFDNNLLRINGDLNINGDYTLPTTAPATGQYLYNPGPGTNPVLAWRSIHTPWEPGPSSGEILYEDGDVGIGLGNAFYRLDVADNTSTGYVARFHNTSAGTSSRGIIIQTGPNSNPSSSVYYSLFLDGNGTNIGGIRGNGSGGTLFSTTSDRRLKQNIKQYSDGLDLIMQMNPTTYQMKSNPAQTEIGFIAQELQEIVPAMVGGNPSDDVETAPMTVDYGRMTPILVSAIQQQQKVIDNQRSELEELKSLIAQQKEDFTNLRAEINAALSVSKSN